MLDTTVACCAACAAVFASKYFIHMLQLESYQGKMYLKWLSGHLFTPFPAYLLALFALLQAAFSIEPWIFMLLPLVGALCFMLLSKRVKAKKPLAYTARVKRLMIAELLLLLLAVLAAAVSENYWIAAIPVALLPITVFAAYLITYPIEESIKRWYFNDAKRKLASRGDSLTRIAITGSFGKTSVKHMLAAILSKRFNVLYTPGSFNTPMGVTRVIRGSLTDEHEIFIAEMGARYVGDIKELCRLVSPDMGLITAIGSQHLETFGSYERLVKTKGELFDALDGRTAFANGDSEDAARLLADCRAAEKVSFGTLDGLSVRAENISSGPNGSSFTLTAGGESVECATRLLGKHNIVNICGAAAVALKLGMSLDEIRSAVSELEPVKNRLELIKGAVTVIDDSFNSNPAGAASALEVLSGFEGRRIVVTPGMVELGSEEAALNREFGRQMAGAAHIAILVGPARTAPIREGLLEAGFPESCIVTVTDLAEATAKLPLYTETGAVVLFENDLPDNYSE